MDRSFPYLATSWQRASFCKNDQSLLSMLQYFLVSLYYEVEVFILRNFVKFY